MQGLEISDQPDKVFSIAASIITQYFMHHMHSDSPNQFPSESETGNQRYSFHWQKTVI